MCAQNDYFFGSQINSKMRTEVTERKKDWNQRLLNKYYKNVFFLLFILLWKQEIIISFNKIIILISTKWKETYCFFLTNNDEDWNLRGIFAKRKWLRWFLFTLLEKYINAMKGSIILLKNKDNHDFKKSYKYQEKRAKRSSLFVDANLVFYY